MASYLEDHNKFIYKEDLQDLIDTYETDFDFIREDIEKYREQNINHECFKVIHPWNYELDLVDLKYVLNNDHIDQIIYLL